MHPAGKRELAPLHGQTAGVSLLVALMALGAVGSGVAASLLPLVVTLAIVAGFVALSAVAVLRVVLVPPGRLGGGWSRQGQQDARCDRADRREPAGVLARPEPDLRVPRLLYYLGLLFIGQLVFRPALALTLSDWLFFASLLMTLPVLLARRYRTVSAIPPLLFVGVVLFAVGGLISSFGAQLPMQSVAVVVRFVYLSIVWFWLGSVLLQRAEHVRLAMTLWVTSAAVTGAGAVAQAFRPTIIPGTEPVWGRMTSFTDHMNDLGGVTCAALAPALALCLSGSETLVKRAFSYVLLFLLGAGLYLSGSIGSLLAAVVSVVLWLAFGKIHPRLLFLFFAAGVAVLLIAFVASATGAHTPVERLEGAADADDPNSSVGSRLVTSQVAWELIREDPFVGRGLDPESAMTETGLEVHNMLLGVWFQAGIWALVGIGCIVLALLALVRRTYLAATPDESTMVIAFAASLFAFLVFAMAAPVLYKRYLWVSSALLIALWAQQVRVEARQDVRS